MFHARVPLDFIRDVFDVCRDTPQHTYQVLTKRSLRLRRMAEKLDWPSNLWMGVSVENAAALQRVEHLRAVPAAVRFLSCEPLLGPLTGLNLDGIHWVIAGGESGPNHRFIDANWVREIRDACQAADSRSSSSSGVVALRKRLAATSMSVGGTKCRHRRWSSERSRRSRRSTAPEVAPVARSR